MFASLDAKTLKVFVLTGQSNSLGTIATTDLTMRSRAPGTHAAEQGGVPFFWDNRADGTTAGDLGLGASGGWVNLGPQTGGYYAGNDDHWGPEIGFSRLMWDAGYRDFAVVKASRGGGGNSFWVKGATDDHMYRHVVTTVQAAVATLPAGFDDYEIAGLLYVQGESNSAAEADVAGDRFSALLANLKADLPHASALCGVFGEIAGSGTSRDTTRTRQKTLADARADVGYAESNGLTLQNQDGLSVHYDADSQILLGERMASEMIGTGATGDAPLPAWAQLHAWLLADHGAAFDSSGAVQRWANLGDGSAARDLTRRVAGQVFRRQVIAAGGATREVLRFDGSSDLWASAAEFGTLSSGRTVAVLCRVNGAGDGFLFDGSTGSGRTRVQVAGGNWQAGITPTGGSWTSAENVTVARTTGVWQRHVFVFDPFDAGGGNLDTRIRHFIDGVQVAVPVDADAGSLSGLIVGSNGGSPFSRLSCEIAEMAVFAKALDATETTALDAAWINRWGAISGPPFSASASQTSATVARFGRHELLHLALDSPTAGTTTLQEVRIHLAPGTRERIARLQLVDAGQGTSFDVASPVLATMASPASDDIVFSCTKALAEGTNHLAVVVEPLRNAPLGATLDASVTGIVCTGEAAGSILPANADPAGALTLGLVPYFADIRKSGQDGVNTWRIPGIVADGDTLHAVFDVRYAGGADLPANIDVGYMRSTDGGATWSPLQLIMDYPASAPNSSGNGVGDPCILRDPVTGTLWVAALWSFGNHAYNNSGAGTDPSVSGQYVLTKSTDGGVTWSDPINITAAVKDDTNWRLVFQGPGHGFAMRDGTLVFPSQYRDAAGTVRSCSVFSPDHGATWDFGSGVPTASPQTNENTACELDDGRLLFSMRTPSGSNGQRAWITYTPGGNTPMRDGSWGSLYRLPQVPDPVCQGSVIQWASKHRGSPRERVLFGNPASSSSRVNFTLRVSQDGGSTWPVSRQLYAGSSAYSSLCILSDNSIGVLFEKDDYSRITFVRVEEGWLMNPDVDTDGDGLPDAWEVLNGTSVSVPDAGADPDGDGRTNLEEFYAGTDPQNGTSFLGISEWTRGAEGMNLEWKSVPGVRYAIETSDELTSWTPVEAQAAVTATGASTRANLPMTGEKKFFRVRVLR